MKKLSVMGSTGSIGTQTLDVVRKYRDRFSVSALSCGRNIALLEEQIREFRGTLTEPGKNSPYRDRTVEDRKSVV